MNVLECGICYTTGYEQEIQNPLSRKASLLPCCNYSAHITCLNSWFQQKLSCPFCKQNSNNQEYKNQLITFFLLSPEPDNIERTKRIKRLFHMHVLNREINELDCSLTTNDKMKKLFREFYKSHVMKNKEIKKTLKDLTINLYETTKVDSEEGLLSALNIENCASDIIKIVITTLFLTAILSAFILPVYWT
jgi:hypothetical protein